MYSLCTMSLHDCVLASLCPCLAVFFLRRFPSELPRRCQPSILSYLAECESSEAGSSIEREDCAIPQQDSHGTWQAPVERVCQVSQRSAHHKAVQDHKGKLLGKVRDEGSECTRMLDRGDTRNKGAVKRVVRVNSIRSDAIKNDAVA